MWRSSSAHALQLLSKRAAAETHTINILKCTHTLTHTPYARPQNAHERRGWLLHGLSGPQGPMINYRPPGGLKHRTHPLRSWRPGGAGSRCSWAPLLRGLPGRAARPPPAPGSGGTVQLQHANLGLLPDMAFSCVSGSPHQGRQA